MLTWLDIGVQETAIGQGANHSLRMMHVKTNGAAFELLYTVKNDQALVRIGLWNLRGHRHFRDKRKNGQEADKQDSIHVHSVNRSYSGDSGIAGKPIFTGYYLQPSLSSTGFRFLTPSH
jgi:hypothetical protein